MTPLDQAHAAMLSGDEAEARQFYRVLADTALVLLLEGEAEGDAIRPLVFELTDGPVLLAFDSEDRLAGFQDGPAPYASLPGRVIAQQMVGQGLSLGLNLGTGAASETLLPPEALAYLLELLDVTPVQAEAQAQVFSVPHVPDQLDEALRFAVTKASGLAVAAVLAGVTYANGGRSHMLAFVEAAESSRPDLARAIAEALSFAGIEAAALDVTFLDATSPALAAMVAVGRVYDVPQPEMPAAPAIPAAPGSDPSKPPKLR